MDWAALQLSVRLALWTCGLLIPLAVVVGRVLAWRSFRGRGFVEGALALPLVLPPTVLGFYLLEIFGLASPLGAAYHAVFGETLVFSFEGMLVPTRIIIKLTASRN